MTAGANHTCGKSKLDIHSRLAFRACWPLTVSESPLGGVGQKKQPAKQRLARLAVSCNDCRWSNVRTWSAAAGGGQISTFVSRPRKKGRKKRERDGTVWRHALGDDAQNFKPSYPFACSTPRTTPVSSHNKGKLACVTEASVFLWFPPRPLSASLTSNMGETWQPSQFRPGQKILTWGFVMQHSDWVQCIHSWGWGWEWRVRYSVESAVKKKLVWKVACANTKQV